jgi:glucose-6-phosphate dehydrogenase assembly protein OpcA
MTDTAIQPQVLGIEVPVGSIDGELKKLWEADEASTNASLMNFAVYSEDPGSLGGNSEIIRRLTHEHACRAILIAMDRDSEEAGIRSWITAHCHLAHGRKSVCCEQLSFLLTGRASGRLRNTVFAHLASDLPLVLWWQGELSDVFEKSLYRAVDRLVFDSSEWEFPADGLARIREAAEDARHRIVVQDLSWTRSFHYRLAVAALFDNLVAQRALPEISEVRIVAHPAHRISAIQLLAWLATQAGWRSGLELGVVTERLAGCEECFHFESASGGSIKARVEWDEEGAPLGLLEIRAPDLVVRVRRDAGETYLSQAVERPGHLFEQCGPADADDPAMLVADQLSRGGKNSLFRKIWPVMFELLGFS